MICDVPTEGLLIYMKRVQYNRPKQHCQCLEQSTQLVHPKLELCGSPPPLHCGGGTSLVEVIRLEVLSSRDSPV